MYESRLTIRCGTCHAIYRHYGVTPPNQPIRYCIYCATQNLRIEVDPEWDIVELLAHEYKCTTQQVRRALAIWQQEVYENYAVHKQPISFHEFMVG